MIRKLSFVTKNVYGMWQASTIMNDTRIMYEKAFYSSSTFVSTDVFKSLPNVYTEIIPREM